MNGAVVVFARAPELGKVKTRLAARHGDQAALALHRAFLTDTIAAVRGADASVVLAHTPGARFPEQRLADHCVEQRGDGFGARFDAALADAHGVLPAGTPLLILGADSPHLAPAAIRGALDALHGHDVILGPNEGHGFYALGFAGPPVPVAAAFAEPDECLALERLMADAGRSCMRLPPHYDLDHPADLERLAAELRHNGHYAPPQTRNVLAQLGLL